MRNVVIVVLVLLATLWMPSGSAEPCIDPWGHPPISTQGECSFGLPSYETATQTYSNGNTTYVVASVSVTDGTISVHLTIVCMVEERADQLSPVPLPAPSCAIYVTPPGPARVPSIDVPPRQLVLGPIPLP